MAPEHALLLHAAFEWAAILAGARLYFHERGLKGLRGALQPQNYAVLTGCLLGAAIGNKAVFWVENPQLWDPEAGLVQYFLGGQSMVGGLLGGYLGVELGKRIAGVRESTGDHFVFPILLGIVIGRVGCLLAGLHDQTFGVRTGLPWGIDFGDGIRRHPTQLYEILFAALLWWAFRRVRARLAVSPGLMFKILLASYLAWRLLVDALKPVPYAYPMGLSGIQVVCAAALVLYLPLLLAQLLRGEVARA
ncbi:MAG: prolipoprotein diacylglyceryl transferase [Gammaproteobacteria bacterium]